MSDAISTGALVTMAAIALVLVIQYLKLQDIWQLIVDCKSKRCWAQIQESENKELRSALRAEKAHVEQLKRKLDLLQALIPAFQGHAHEQN
jgi:predicted RNase H-like nuclease (RuvC/YqgF family)